MEPNPNEIPDYMRTTYDMLKAAYPDIVPKADLYPLMALLSEAGMSDRSVAHAIILITKDNYMNTLYIVRHIVPNEKIRQKDLERVLAKLREQGYDDWVKTVY